MEYKAVDGYEGAYEISDTGISRSLDRLDSGGRFRPGIVLKPSFNHNGYLKITLWKNAKAACFRIHCLVAAAFIGPRPHGYEVNHKDTNKLNNHVSNLEYITPLANIQHAIAMGVLSHKGINNGMAILTEEQVLLIREIGKSGDYTQAEIGEMFGVEQTRISKILLGKTWKHLPA